MAKELEIEFFSSGFAQILTSAGVMSAVQSVTSDIKARANANNTRGGTGFHSGHLQSLVHEVGGLVEQLLRFQ